MNKETIENFRKEERKIVNADSIENFISLVGKGRKINVEGVINIFAKDVATKFSTRYISQTNEDEVLIFNEVHKKINVNLENASKNFDLYSYYYFKLFITTEDRLGELQKILPNKTMIGPKDRMSKKSHKKLLSNAKKMHIEPFRSSRI